MNRKEKINLIKKLEVGTFPVEYFQPVSVKIDFIHKNHFNSIELFKNDEDLDLIDLDINNKNFGLNPFTGYFYGVIKILVVLS